jgi:hypothetical protein
LEGRAKLLPRAEQLRKKREQRLRGLRPQGLYGFVYDEIEDGACHTMEELQAIAVGHSEGPALQRGEYETMIRGAVLPENLFGYRAPGWM